MKIENLFEINNEIKYISGKSGSGNIVKYIDVVEIPEGVYWVKEGDFIITTGYFLLENKDYFTKFISTLIENKASGLGIKIGKFITEIPENILKISEKNKFPIISIPLHLSYRSIIQPVIRKLDEKNNRDTTEYKSVENFFLNIISGSYSNELRLKNEAEYLKIDYALNRCLCILEYSKELSEDNFESLFKKIKNLSCFKEFLYIPQAEYKRTVLICNMENKGNSPKKIKFIFDNFLKNANSDLKNNNLQLSVSNCFKDLYKLNFAYQQANFALKVGRILNNNEKLFFYSDYAVYHLIHENIDSLIISDMYNNFVSKLKEYDKENKSNLYFTLKNLEKNDFSINKTSEKIFVHRNTLYKRINKINNLLECNINEPNNKLKISIAIKFDELINKTN